MAGDSENTRTLILDAAVRAFLTTGYEGVSMEAVATRAGVARRTVFNQFESKEGLFGAAVERLWKRLELSADAHRDGDAVTAEQALTLMAERIVSFWEQPEAIPLARLVISEGERFAILRDSFIGKGRQPAHAMLTARFRELADQGCLVVLDPALAAEQFVSLIKDVLWWPVLIGETSPPDPARRRLVVASAVEVMLRAYARRDGGRTPSDG